MLGNRDKRVIEVYLVHTTQVSSFPSGYLSHGRAPPWHLVSVMNRRDGSMCLWVLGRFSGSRSTQTKSDVRGWPCFSPIRYPWYSRVQPSGHVILAGIIRYRVRLETSQTTQGASWSWVPLSSASSNSRYEYSTEYIKPRWPLLPFLTKSHSGFSGRHR